MRRVIDGVAACLALVAASLAAPAQTPPAPAPQPPAQLTLAQAERIAIQNNPNIGIARLLTLAQGQVAREARSASMPTLVGNMTAVGAHDNTRITAGVLNNPSVYDRAAGGLTVSELITDFGRTHNLVLSAKSTARAQLESERATQQDITLTVDQAFYRALTAQAVLKVAHETVNERQATSEQVAAMTKANLRSQVDLSFAQVQLSQAQLMLLDAQDQAETAMAALDTVLGFEQDNEYALVDPTPANPAPPPQNAESLVQQAFTARPDLAAANDNFTAATQFSKAERDLRMPTVSALAAVGGTPVRADQIQSSWYGAAGANISIPIFNGFLFNAREQEAKLRASASQQQVRSLRDNIARDVRTSVLNAQDAFQRIRVSREMLTQSNLALDLSQRRYQLGLSSIVELTQAQLAQTQAQISVSDARYAYATALSVLHYQLGR
ncbi:MAG TPA: TolC family protein [Acidobacteriaceae bacterium]|nr:TolC family protein [Acidobacteriaceae bacterium]